jgi:hypothetical protein
VPIPRQSFTDPAPVERSHGLGMTPPQVEISVAVGPNEGRGDRCAWRVIA